MKLQKYFVISLCFLLFVTFSAKADNKYIGSEYLGEKYISDPLGEEKLPDTDPLIRYDAFDCMTFVETSLAGGNLDKLNKIRYKDGNIDFLNRNHFVEYDWVKNNSELVKNVSSKYGKTKIRKEILDKKSWFKKVHNLDTRFKKVNVQIEYIPYENLKDINLKKPLIILFVMNNKNMVKEAGTDLAVSHMGFLLPGGILRHASTKQKKVVDINFKDYIEKQKQSKSNIGVAFFEIKNDR
ncbi:MAG TPA: DUF1460 domain-containing protein [Alphaproteobacteria bacterium]|nr:DUF1460 domain-containing protein [Alphaproteobacteria bacterium]